MLKRLATLGILLIASCPFFGQATTGYHRISQVLQRAPQGGVDAQVVPYASVYVTSASTGLAATIYSDPLLTSPIANSTVTTDENGNYGYYIPLGQCETETITYPGGGSITNTNVCTLISGTVTGQANGVIPLATGVSTIGAQSHLSDNGSLVTSSIPLSVTGAVTASGGFNGTATGNLPLTGGTLTGPVAWQGGPTASPASTTLANLGAVSSVQTSPQTMAGPLYVSNINTFLNASLFSGASVSAQIQAAVSACASISCSGVEIPSNMGTGYWSFPLPSNVTVYDFRGGSMRVFNDNTTARSSGYPTLCGFYSHSSSFPPVSPGGLVTCYIEANGGVSSDQDAVTLNTNANLNLTPGYFAGGSGTEVDTWDFGTGSYYDPWTFPGSTTGQRWSVGGTNHAMSSALYTYGVYSNYGANFGLTLSGITGSLIKTDNYRQFHTTQAITGSGTPQTVTLDASQFYIGEYVSIGGENVLVTGATGTTITGVFTQSHPSGVAVSSYAAQYGIDFGTNQFAQSPVLLGSLQIQNGFNSPINLGLLDSSGTFRMPFWWDTANNTHVRSVGGNVDFEDVNGNVQAQFLPSVGTPQFAIGNPAVFDAPFLDFYSSGNSVTDVQLEVTGGSGTPNQGTLTILAGAVTTSAPFKSGSGNTFVCTAGGTITISNANVDSTSDITISMAPGGAGGTITTPPAFKTVTSGVGFTVLCGASDTSTYRYRIWN